MAQSSHLDGIKTSRVSPAFLHGNSTSHTWPFSAIAELIDNAYDPDVNASELWIDKRTHNGVECLTFVDNGNGLTEEKLYKMLSFGYCDKIPIGGVKPIGHYGNGFKSGSMRLGMNAMVFTRCTKSTSVGFLSQSYLKAINADAVLVPIVTWDHATMTRVKSQESDQNLLAILRHSLFNMEKDLFNELKALERMKTGTNIIIYDLRRDKSGTLELDFNSDKHDIRNPETHVIDLTSINRPIHTALPEYRRSLREYCSILFLKPRMKIVLRGQKVVTKLISKSLSRTEIDTYRPTWLPRPIKLTFGFTDKAENESYGLMMYHHNRLILAYEKIGCQKQANQHGVGVVGVVEANFLDPIHNKQDFNRTDRYSAFMQNAAMKLNDYYFEKTQNENPERDILNQSQLPDWTWAQCDNCLSWRRLPTGYVENLPDKWYCRMNPDAAFNRCDIPEEPEDDEEALQPTYRKTYKKKEEEKKKQLKYEEAQKRLLEEQKIREKAAKLAQKEKMLQHKMKEFNRKNTELAEVSSSQDKVDRKPTVRDLEQAQVNLQRSQQKLAQQEQLISQLEQQKQENEEKKMAMLRLAKSIELNSVQEQKLVNKVKDMHGTSNTTVSSSSSHLRAPVKRKADNNNGPAGKMVKIKTEDGGSISINMDKTSTSPIDLTLDSDEEEEASSKDKSVNDNSGVDMETSDTTVDSGDTDKTVETASGSKKQKDTSGTSTDVSKEDATNKEKAKGKTKETSKVKTKEIANTEPIAGSSKIDEKGDNNSKTDKEDSTYTEMEDDVKPLKEELDRQIQESTHKTVLAHKGSQTVPTVVKFASPEEVDLQKLSQIEQKQMLLQKARELDETKKGLKSLQENIAQLLKIIVPDFDYGNAEDIESIILDFIRVNGEKS